MNRGVDWAQFGIWYLVFLFSTTLHEAAHAWVANRGGDTTASDAGHLTLDPSIHIRRSPFGMVLIPIITFVQMGFLMGWASVPFNPRWGKRYPRRQALMSLAGPMANFFLAIVGLIAVQISVSYGVLRVPEIIRFTELVVPTVATGARSFDGALAVGLSVLINLNVLLGLFNLLPLPPLDGAGVLEGLFPDSVGRFFDSIRSVPMIQLITLVIAWQIMPQLINPAFGVVAALVRMTA